MRKLFITLLVIFLPLFLLLSSTEYYGFKEKFYLDSFVKNQVAGTSGKSLEDLELVTQDLLSYLKDKGDEELLARHFNFKEIEHMKDVKVLFKGGFILKYLSLFISLALIFLGLKTKDYFIARGFFRGVFIWWGLFLTLSLLTVLDFNKYFTYFHLIFFDNDLWLLDPNTDLLIQMLPEEFFISIFLQILLSFILSLAIIQMIAYIIMKKGRDRNGNLRDSEGIPRRS